MAERKSLAELRFERKAYQELLEAGYARQSAHAWVQEAARIAAERRAEGYGYERADNWQERRQQWRQANGLFTD